MIADILEHLACRADVDIGTVCFTNEDGTPSYENGLFASGRSIARGTFIGFYTGEWVAIRPRQAVQAVEESMALDGGR